MVTTFSYIVTGLHLTRQMNARNSVATTVRKTRPATTAKIAVLATSQTVSAIHSSTRPIQPTLATISAATSRLSTPTVIPADSVTTRSLTVSFTPSTINATASNLRSISRRNATIKAVTTNTAIVTTSAQAASF